MLTKLICKARQLKADPVLRRWLLGRVFNRWKGTPAFRPHHPPYLRGLLPLPEEAPAHDFKALETSAPRARLTLQLAGERIDLQPGEEATLFRRHFDDVETLLSLHRFAWLNATDKDIDPAWVAALWQAWLDGFSKPSDDWAWHPYTASERAVNLLKFARRHGLPGDQDRTIAVLAAHAPAIATQLEYFGDHHTSNHLANNGRGLLMLGLELGLSHATYMGAKILQEEAGRIFTASGFLREGSSHYHLLCLHLYETAAAATQKAGRAEAPELQAVADKARAAAQDVMMLPGGLPLIGDISPDISPPRLLADLELNSAEGSARGSVEGAGWLRISRAPWFGLWHASPDGFSQMPGHGHQDTGGFELHYQDEAVFIDPGRGRYGEHGEAALYRSATMHNTLMLDGEDSFPANRPYYDDAFRRHVAGPAPQLAATDQGVTLSHHGFCRFAHGGVHERTWRFEGQRMTLQDKLDGRGQATIRRTLITPLAVEIAEGQVLIKGRKATYILDAGDDQVTLEPVTRWLAYGQGVAVQAIVINRRAALPFAGSLTLEAKPDAS